MKNQDEKLTKEDARKLILECLRASKSWKVRTDEYLQQQQFKAAMAELDRLENKNA